MQKKMNLVFTKHLLKFCIKHTPMSYKIKIDTVSVMKILTLRN